MRNLIKKVIYTLWDYLTLRRGLKRIINHDVILFPPQWHKYFESNYEGDNISFLKNVCQEGMTVIDVGAHLGLVTIVAAKQVGSSGRVYSFEPTNETFLVLQRMLKLNQVEDIVRCVPKVVSDSNEPVDFFIDENFGSNSNSIVKRSDKKRRLQYTEAIKIDSFVDGNQISGVILIKIDAEGAELNVLKGAEITLSRFRPFVILAIHPILIKNNGQRLEDIFDFIERNNFQTLYQGSQILREDFISKKELFDVHLVPVPK